MNNHPLKSDWVLPADRQRLLKEHLMREIQHQPAPRRRPVRRFVIPAATLTAAAGVIAALVLTGGATRTAAPADALPSGTHAQAVVLLDKIATVAYSQQLSAPRNDQFVYIDSKGSSSVTSPAGTTLTPAHRRQVWLSVDGSKTGLLKEDGETGPLPAYPGSLNAPTYAFLSTLPTDPNQLLALIDKEEVGHGTGLDAEAFVTIGDLLGEALVPANLSAALYRAAALIPGVVLVPDSTDAIGRHGVAVARVDTVNGDRQEWIFDSTTLQFLGEREIQAFTVHAMRAGTILSDSAVLRRAIVDKAGQTP